MDQAERMDHLQRGRHRENRFTITADRFGTGNAEQGAQQFSFAKKRIAHRLVQNNGGSIGGGSQAVEGGVYFRYPVRGVRSQIKIHAPTVPNKPGSPLRGAVLQIL